MPEEEGYVVYDGHYQAKPQRKTKDSIDTWHIEFAVSILTRLAADQNAAQLAVRRFRLDQTALEVIITRDESSGLGQFGFIFALDALRAGFSPDDAVTVAGAYIGNLRQSTWQESHVVDGVCWYRLPADPA